MALGDSATSGVGDSSEDGSPRGWARILAGAIAESHDVSFCNVASPGSTAADVWQTQLPEAVAHRAHMAALVVGVNDTMRASWNAATLRTHLLMCAAALTSRGALLMTVRFHDHSRVMRLPGPLSRRMTKRIGELNEILDEVHETYGGVRVDLGGLPQVYERRFWTADRLHPSDVGHRALAAEFARHLHRHGLAFPAPSVDHVAPVPRPFDDLRWVLTEVVPWLARRARELGPPLAQSTARAIRMRLWPEVATEQRRS